MAQAVVLSSIGLINYGFGPNAKINYGQSRSLVSTSIFPFRPIRAVQDNEGPRRLVDIIRSIPELSRNYFKSPSRRALFGGISLLGGFYVAQTISLSFGALGVNDVIAAVLCVLLTEYVTKFYYSRPKLINCYYSQAYAHHAHLLPRLHAKSTPVAWVLSMAKPCEYLLRVHCSCARLCILSIQSLHLQSTLKDYVPVAVIVASHNLRR